MNSDETLKLRRIMNGASNAAQLGNGAAHTIYVALRDFLDVNGEKNDNIVIDGFAMTPEIMSFVKNGEVFNGIKKIRSVHGLPLKEAKDIYEKLVREI